MTVESQQKKVEPALKLAFISHGTLECVDVDATRKFYEEFFGFQVVKTSSISLWLRLGSNHIYVAVQTPEAAKREMPYLNHNGLDVATEGEVDAAHKIVCEQAEKWGLHKISRPIVQHGTYSFYFWDRDNNCWEILSNPEGGYSWMFERGDQQGAGHLKKTFARPESTLRSVDKK